MADSSRNSTKTKTKTSGGDIETVVPPPKEVKILEKTIDVPPNKPPPEVWKDVNDK